MDKNTPLHYAAQNGCTEIVKLLLAHDADVNAKNNNNDTALNIAEKTNNTEVEYFLRKFQNLKTKIQLCNKLLKN